MKGPSPSISDDAGSLVTAASNRSDHDSFELPLVVEEPTDTALIVPLCGKTRRDNRHSGEDSIDPERGLLDGASSMPNHEMPLTTLYVPVDKSSARRGSILKARAITDHRPVSRLDVILKMSRCPHERSLLFCSAALQRPHRQRPPSSTATATGKASRLSFEMRRPTDVVQV